MTFLVRLTLGFAAIVFLIGVVAFLGQPEDSRSATALIPAGFAIAIALSGLATMNPNIGRYAGMLTTLLTVLLILGVMRGVGNFISAVTEGGEISLGAGAQVVVLILALLYLGVVGQHMMARAKAK